MKKTIIKSITFILIFIMMLAVLSQIFVKKNNIKKEKTQENVAKGIAAEPANTIDVLVVGDSEGYSSYIPLEAWNDYGFTSYVCATPRQILSHTMTFISEAVKEQDIKIVLLEANCLYRRTKPSKAIAEVAYNVLPIFEYHDRWKNLKLNDFTDDVNYTNIQESKGYYYSAKIKVKPNTKIIKKANPNPKVPKENNIYIKQIKKYCDSKGIKLIMYSAPYKLAWNMNRHNGIAKIAKEIGVEYVDLNLEDSIGIDWKKDTRDGGEHLNYTGASKATKYLSKYLYDTNLLPDHRQDSNYSDWNKLYEKFKQKIEK